jgi:hypothetical protein
MGNRVRPVGEADNADICEPIVYTVSDPEHLTTLYGSTACYVNNCFICR